MTIKLVLCPCGKRWAEPAWTPSPPVDVQVWEIFETPWHDRRFWNKHGHRGPSWHDDGFDRMHDIPPSPIEPSMLYHTRPA